MLAFFRRVVASPIGAVLMGLILLAFVVTLYDARSFFGGGGVSGGNLAKAGSTNIGEAEVRRRLDLELNAARQQQPQLDMTQFVAAGGLDNTLRQIIDGRSMIEFGERHGLVVSDRLLGSMIAQIPGFKGPTGKFDEMLYRATLERLRLSDAQFRKDFSNDAIINMLQKPVRFGLKLPAGVSNRYAALLLEGRKGLIGVVPAELFASGAAPSDAEIAAYYGRNVGRYTLPERRIVRYALFDRERFRGKVAPTDAEVARYYQQNNAEYAARELRGMTQVIISGKADADKAYAAVKAGKPIGEVAKSLGLVASTVPQVEEKDFAKQSSPEVARAAFKAAKGSVAELARSGLGYHLVRVDSVTGTKGQSLAEARASIVSKLTEQKIDEAASAFATALEDEAGDGATFDDLVKKYALTPVVTPAVTASGANPEQPDYKPAPEMALILRDAFRAEPDEDPAVVQLGTGKTAALWKLDKIVAAAPRPLAAIREQVAADAKAEAAAKAAQKAADGIAARIAKGMGFAEAMAGAGVPLPAPRPAGGRRLDIVQAGDRVPPPLALMFSMAPRTAKVLAMPGNRGAFVVFLESIQSGDAASVPGLADQTRGQLSQLAGQEMLLQFVAAVKAEVGTSRNDAAIAALKQALTGARGPRQ